jgi:hypothetical protein
VVVEDKPVVVEAPKTTVAAMKELAITATDIAT